VGWPDDNHIKFLLKVTNLYNSLGLAYIKHPAHQDETTVNLVPLNLINEREVILVGKKRLIGWGREMILEDVQDQLVDNAKLDLVAANKALVGIIVAIESNYLAAGRVRLESVSEKDIVVSIVPLCELLTLGGGDFRPLREQINLLHGDFHRLFAIGELVLGTVKRAITSDRNVHKKAPPEIFTLVLEELEELISGGDGNIEMNVIARGFWRDEPAFLISLLREVPVLIERTDDTVVCRCRSHFSGGWVGSRGRALVVKRATKIGENGRISSGFGEAASVKVVINCELKSNWWTKKIVSSIDL
jgi:hypothetical protein